MRPHREQPTRLRHPWDSPGKNNGVGCHVLPRSMKEKSEGAVTQSCPTLHDPMDCSLPGSSAHGIFQARVLEWGAIAFSAWVMRAGQPQRRDLNPSEIPLCISFVSSLQACLMQIRASQNIVFWATVSSQSCFCWLYRASLFLAAKKYNQYDFSIDHLVMSVCRVVSSLVGRGCLL